MSDLVRLRGLVRSFLVDDVLPAIRPNQSVLEIGPMHAGSCPVPDAFVDTAQAIRLSGASYESCDPDPAAGADYQESFLDLAGVDAYDHVIACEVLEHVTAVWEAPAVLSRLLRTGGTLWFSMPFWFEQHGPAPDCWRFTAAGIRALFGPQFSLEIKASDEGTTPLHYRVIARKK